MSKNNEKYTSWLTFIAVSLQRYFIRAKIAPLVKWEKQTVYQDGCTIIIGMCSSLKDVLTANLKCLEAVLWKDITEIIITVDTVETEELVRFEKTIRTQFPALPLKFLYYSKHQHAVSEYLKLPYVYSWLSWSIALNHCQTRVAFIHDYDALIFGDALQNRHMEFVTSNVKMQGIKWYWVNGLTPEDKLASTFEAFVDVEWIKKFQPISMFNDVRFWKKRRVDFDTLLQMQAYYLSDSERSIVEMDNASLIHPTQMIHQYTMAKKMNGRPWFCSALLMIPFFYYLSGRNNFLDEVAIRIRNILPSKKIDFLDDGVKINFKKLSSTEVTKMLMYMQQVCFNLGIERSILLDYGNALYALAGAENNASWVLKETIEPRVIPPKK